MERNDARDVYWCWQLRNFFPDEPGCENQGNSSWRLPSHCMLQLNSFLKIKLAELSQYISLAYPENLFRGVKGSTRTALPLAVWGAAHWKHEKMFLKLKKYVRKMNKFSKFRQFIFLGFRVEAKRLWRKNFKTKMKFYCFVVRMAGPPIYTNIFNARGKSS